MSYVLNESDTIYWKKGEDGRWSCLTDNFLFIIEKGTARLYKTPNARKTETIYKLSVNRRNGGTHEYYFRNLNDAKLYANLTNALVYPFARS